MAKSLDEAGLILSMRSSGIQHSHEYGCGRMGGHPYISTPRNEWLLAILSVLRVAERMKQVEQSCIGAGKVSPEPEVELRR